MTSTMLVLELTSEQYLNIHMHQSHIWFLDDQMSSACHISGAGRDYNRNNCFCLRYVDEKVRSLHLGRSTFRGNESIFQSHVKVIKLACNDILSAF